MNESQELHHLSENASPKKSRLSRMLNLEVFNEKQKVEEKNEIIS